MEIRILWGIKVCVSVKDLAIFVVVTVVTGLLVSLVELPSCLHELDKVVIVVDGRANSSVVLVPFVSLDFSVTVSVTEASEEFQEDLIFSHLTRLNFRVHAAVVDATEVGGGDLTTAVSVELEEGLVNHSLSLGVQGSLANKSSNLVSL